MSEQVHLAFIILAPGGASTNARSDNGFTLTLATVDTIEAAVQLTRNLTGQGVTNIELSAGFGDDGLAEIRKVAGTGVRVGRVRYEP
ncbi:DUF6506 family protein [Marinobacter sp.]|uniref:DUF6506 family protein n=1 Tax=Marinobacter sp. TaxID=50741 RepID=UPI00384E9854